jgi:hypothetical protein
MSEPMMLGLGQGFGFIYWKMNFMKLPFIGGRSKPIDFTKVLCSNINIDLEVRETTSVRKAWQNISEYIDIGQPVGLQVDCYHLEHFNHAFHFAGHFITIYGYENEYAYIADTGKKYKVSLRNLEKARFEKGQMAGKALSYTLKRKGSIVDLKSIIPKALNAVATEFLQPPLKCFGFLGIQKLSKEMLNWENQIDNPNDLIDQSEMMENAGTGGAIFRNFYRDYLFECMDVFPGNKKIEKAAELYKEAAKNWSTCADLIRTAGENNDMSLLQIASDICYENSRLEKEAMEQLVAI